jgi:lipopolysaccharide transport system ATP-binding protein
MTAVNSLCNRGIYLLNGKIHDVGKVEDVISKYLSKSKKKSHVIFDGNAENEFIKINTIELLNNSDGYFKIDEPQRIQVNLKNKNIEDLINVNLYFNTFEGGLIFASVSEIKKIPIGGFICICNIPANFLNDTSYFLDIMVVKNGEIPLMHLKNIMLIEGIEPIRETAWFGKFPGLIRPKLNWEFKF